MTKEGVACLLRSKDLTKWSPMDKVVKGMQFKLEANAQVEGEDAHRPKLHVKKGPIEDLLDAAHGWVTRA